MPIVEVVDRLVRIVETAKSVPLTNQVRIDREAVYEILDEIRGTVVDEVPPGKRDEPNPALDFLVLVDRLDDVVHDARAVPLTDQVRVSRADVLELVTEMRAKLDMALARKPGYDPPVTP